MILDEKMDELTVARVELGNVKSKYDERFEKFRDDEKEVITSIEAVGNLIKDIESEIRTEAVNMYTSDPTNKKFGCGVGIRVGEALEYDEEEAFSWATEHKICLQLNKKAFEKYAKIEDVVFVDKVEKITATIPKNLTSE